jgi:hypothetical protein
MPLLTELGGLADGFSYRHAALDGRFDPLRRWFGFSTEPEGLKNSL